MFTHLSVNPFNSLHLGTILRRITLTFVEGPLGLTLTPSADRYPPNGNTMSGDPSMSAVVVDRVETGSQAWRLGVQVRRVTSLYYS